MTVSPATRGCSVIGQRSVGRVPFAAVGLAREGDIIRPCLSRRTSPRRLAQTARRAVHVCEMDQRAPLFVRGAFGNPNSCRQMPARGVSLSTASAGSVEDHVSASQPPWDSEVGCRGRASTWCNLVDPTAQPHLRASLLADAVRVLTAAARLTRPAPGGSGEGRDEPVDWAEFVTLAWRVRPRTSVTSRPFSLVGRGRGRPQGSVGCSGRRLVLTISCYDTAPSRS